MRLILSRKGFDSASGGVANPVLPSGRMCMLPIPEQAPGRALAPPYDEILFDGAPIGTMVEQLTRGRISATTRAHLDPDLCSESRPRAPGWRPVFGQSGAAERHLRNQHVGPGDIFLFFAWLRHTELRDGRLCYRTPEQSVHALLGWLQIERRIP